MSTNPMTVNPEIKLDLLDNMLRIRRFEEKVRELFLNNRLPGFVHTYIGEEAVAVGVCSALNNDDYITSTHRGHGHCIAKGLDFDRMYAELMGKATGYCGGKGGSMHIADFNIGVMGANGIVGAGLPIATGLGVACQMENKRQVAVCFFGDGALAQGVFHESLNIASLWSLPVIYVCENNQFGEWTHWSKQHAVDDPSTRASAYRMPGDLVDGMKVLDVYEASCRAVERARTGKGPSLLVCNTYRYDGHAAGDRRGEQAEDEYKEWLKKDPIETFSKSLKDEGLLTQAELEEKNHALLQEIETAIKFAEASAYPISETALQHIFTE